MGASVTKGVARKRGWDMELALATVDGWSAHADACSISQKHDRGAVRTGGRSSGLRLYWTVVKTSFVIISSYHQITASSYHQITTSSYNHIIVSLYHHIFISSFHHITISPSHQRFSGQRKSCSRHTTFFAAKENLVSR